MSGAADSPPDGRWQLAATAVVGATVAVVSCLYPMRDLYLVGVALTAGATALFGFTIVRRRHRRRSLAVGGAALTALAVGVPALAVPWTGVDAAERIGVRWSATVDEPGFDYAGRGEVVLARDPSGVRFLALDGGEVLADFPAAGAGSSSSTQVALAADGSTVVGVGDSLSLVDERGSVVWTHALADVGLDAQLSWRARAASGQRIVVEQCVGPVEADDDSGMFGALETSAGGATGATGSFDRAATIGPPPTDAARCELTSVGPDGGAAIEVELLDWSPVAARLRADDATATVLPEVVVGFPQADGDGWFSGRPDDADPPVVLDVTGVELGALAALPVAAVGSTVITVSDGPACTLTAIDFGGGVGAGAGERWTADGEFCLTELVAFGSRLYAGNESGRTITVGLADGTWRYVDESHAVELGDGGAALIRATGVPGDDVIVDRYGNGVETVDAATGDVLWTASFDGELVGTPDVGGGAVVVRSRPAGNNPLVSAGDGVFVSVFDAATGERRGRLLVGDGVWAAVGIEPGTALVASTGHPSLTLVGSAPD